MRNFLMAVLIIGLPAVAVGAFLLYGPEIYDKVMRDGVNPLDKKFSTVVGEQVVVGKMNDYTILDTVKTGQGKSSSGVSRSAQVAAALKSPQENYYHDIQIDEIVNRNTEFYDLNASNPDELRKAILENAPANADSGRHSVSKMSYGVDWNLDTVQENGECRLLGAKVITNITMLMPRWNGVEDMGEDARRAWGEYLESVRNYGDKHNRIMEGVSRQIAERIRFVKKQALCSDLINEVNNIGTTMLSDARDRVKRYRSETGGGKQMGVRLPVFADDLAPAPSNIITDTVISANEEFVTKSEVPTKEVKKAKPKVEQVQKDSLKSQNQKPKKVSITKLEASKVATPKVETSKVETSKVETPKVETPKVETPKVETSKVETSKVETPKVETPKVETPKVETSKVETSKVETPKVETPKVETPKVETSKVETSKVETPKVETSKVETSKVETPNVETSKVETPKVETPKVETPKVETPKVESSKIESSPAENATLKK